MAVRRIGILIANSRFPKEPKLEDLRYPENDVDGLKEVLAAKDRGSFDDIISLKNKPRYEILPVLNKTLTTANKNDLILIYYSGHGKLNRAGRLHLTTLNSEFGALEATAISIGSIRELIDVSETKKIVLVLDCCFSGAIGDEFLKGDVDSQLQLASEGRGTYIMTASTGIQVAKEKEADRHGIFTKNIIGGIRSGEADLDGNGLISMDELYTYVHEKVLEESHQQPMKWNLNVRGDLIIAESGRKQGEERRQRLREIIFDLGKEGLPNDILHKALNIIDLEPEKISSDQLDYNNLLDKLLHRQIKPLAFIGAWRQIRTEEPTKAMDAPTSQKKPTPPTDQPKPSEPNKEIEIPDPTPKTPPSSKKREVLIGLVTMLFIFSGVGIYFYSLNKQKSGPYSSSLPVASKDQVASKQLAAPIEPAPSKQPVEIKPQEKISNSLEMTFVYIPPGTFMMGSPEKEPGRNNDELQHQVTLTKGFYMQTTEVTQGQWKALMGSNPSNFKECGEDCPVDNVSWQDVQKFIDKLNEKERRYLYRLPTEAEWEYAARAGTATTYYTGETEKDLERAGWCAGELFDQIHPVAQKEPNDFGLYDMHGNVWEWCQDWYAEDLDSKEVTDPKGPTKGSYRVVRGGSFVSSAEDCRTGNRSRLVPDYNSEIEPWKRKINDVLRYFFQGFRLIRLPSKKG